MVPDGDLAVHSLRRFAILEIDLRQIVLDTETTGLEPEEGHRIIEIGCVEIRNRRTTGQTYHRYLCPDRRVDRAAVEVHGLSDEILADQPRFADIASEFLEFVRGAELLIHNADFDTGFLDSELDRLVGQGVLADHCTVVDTLELARRIHPGQRNTLDALCGRYHVDNSKRDLHGALLDAQLLAEVYLAMTGGQVSLSLEKTAESGFADAAPRRIERRDLTLTVVRASADELAAHQARLAAIDRESGGRCVWARLEAETHMAEAQAL